VGDNREGLLKRGVYILSSFYPGRGRGGPGERNRSEAFKGKFLSKKSRCRPFRDFLYSSETGGKSPIF